MMSTRSLRFVPAALAAGVALTSMTPLHAQATHAQPAARTAGIVAVRGTVTGSDIVRVARKYLGVRYRLGGTTPRAFDCSGFVRYVFGEYGIGLPRTAHEQAALGTAPFPGDLRPGDLLFFYGGRGAQHIAIYIGADTIIHASSASRRVRLDLLSTAGKRKGWLRQRLIAVRRLAPTEGLFYFRSTAASHVASDPEVPTRASGTLTAAPAIF
jgi:cell wall-associated NlpC family hydrolase